MKNIQLQADENGLFGGYGGRYVPETLMPAIQELKAAYDEAKEDVISFVKNSDSLDTWSKEFFISITNKLEEKLN